MAEPGRNPRVLSRVGRRDARRVRALVTAVGDGDAVVWPAVSAGALVAAVSLLIGSKRGDVRVDVAMASMAAFLFGVLFAFTIVRTRERLAPVQELVAKDNAGTLLDPPARGGVPPEDSETIRGLVDDHLTDQIDYRLVDYYRAIPRTCA